MTQCEMDPKTAKALDKLTPQAVAAMKGLGCDLTKPSEIAEQKVEAVMQQIQKGLDEANKNSQSNAQKVRAGL